MVLHYQSNATLPIVAFPAWGEPKFGVALLRQLD
jgi:hypothetical protein